MQVAVVRVVPGILEASDVGVVAVVREVLLLLEAQDEPVGRALGRGSRRGPTIAAATTTATRRRESEIAEDQSGDGQSRDR